jgi:hypothetical protein
MAKPHRNEANPGRSTAHRRVGVGRLRPATRRLDEVLAERGPLTGPITDAGTRALVAVRGESSDDEHGKP